MRCFITQCLVLAPLLGTLHAGSVEVDAVNDEGHPQVHRVFRANSKKHRHSIRRGPAHKQQQDDESAMRHSNTHRFFRVADSHHRHHNAIRRGTQGLEHHVQARAAHTKAKHAKVAEDWADVEQASPDDLQDLDISKAHHRRHAAHRRVPPIEADLGLAPKEMEEEADATLDSFAGPDGSAEPIAVPIGLLTPKRAGRMSHLSDDLDHIH
mmetsp:Transcript_94049/g.242957  ORF Transcript_94049/g.242957 Transcript_94049/m.242957 type:complete len:210 (-) Transcript_94049:41-670(-)